MVEKSTEEIIAYYGNVYAPFNSEIEWINWTNTQCNIFCNRILSYDGVGKFADPNLQKIADIVFAYKKAEVTV